MREFQAFSTSMEATFNKIDSQQDLRCSTDAHTPSQRRQVAASNYEEPENFLEVEVLDPQTHFPHGDSTNGMYTDYLVVCRTNLPGFRKRESSVRRRYRDFECFRRALHKELAMSSHPRVAVPSLPGKLLLSNRFSDEVIEARRQGLACWLATVAGHPLLQSSSHALVQFLEDEVIRF